VIYHDLCGKRIEREIPISLSKSLAFVRKSVRRIPQLHTHRAELEWICQEAKRLADIRKDLGSKPIKVGAPLKRAVKRSRP
jgi:hypothetical protein